MTTRPGSELAAQLVDPELYRTGPFPLYARLRAEAPVAWNEERGFWALTRYAEVFAVESDAQTFFTQPEAVVWRRVEILKSQIDGFTDCFAGCCIADRRIQVTQDRRAAAQRRPPGCRRSPA